MTDDAIFEAKVRGEQRKRQIIQDIGGTLTCKEVASVLGIAEQVVDERRACVRLLAIDACEEGYLYPQFQFEGGKTIDGLEAVLAFLEHHDPWSQMIFFTTAHERLAGKTPTEALRFGMIEEVAQVARVFGEQGAV